MRRTQHESSRDTHGIPILTAWFDLCECFPLESSLSPPLDSVEVVAAASSLSSLLTHLWFFECDEPDVLSSSPPLDSVDVVAAASSLSSLLTHLWIFECDEPDVL